MCRKAEERLSRMVLVQRPARWDHSKPLRMR
jgi:hypothetical protein